MINMNALIKNNKGEVVGEMGLDEYQKAVDIAEKEQKTDKNKSFSLSSEDIKSKGLKYQLFMLASETKDLEQYERQRADLLKRYGAKESDL